MVGTRDSGVLGKHPLNGEKSHDKHRGTTPPTRDCPKRGADDSGDEHPLGVGIDIKP